MCSFTITFTVRPRFPPTAAAGGGCGGSAGGGAGVRVCNGKTRISSVEGEEEGRMGVGKDIAHAKTYTFS